MSYFFGGNGGGGGGGGDVVGPASSTTNAVALFADTTGKLLQNSVVLINPATGVSTGFSTITVNAAGQFIATTGAAPSAGVDLVKISAVDYASGDARLNIQGESGGAIRIGNSTVSLGTNGIVESNTGTLTLSAATGLLGTIAGNTAAAFKIFDGGGEKYYNIDTRLTTAGVSAHEWQVNTSGFAIASGAGNLARQGLFATYNLAYTGTTQVTSLVDSIKIEGPTISSNTATLTIDQAAGLSLKAPIQGTNVSITNNSALRIRNGGAGAANYGIYIEDQTGGTTDFGLAIGGADTAALWLSSDADTTDAPNGIFFGLSRDTGIYRSGVNQLTMGSIVSPSISYDATVGATGADYTTISGALAASKTRLLVIDDVTEVSACAVPSTGLVITVLPGVTVAMGTNQFTFAGNYNLSIYNQDVSSLWTFGYTAATNTRLFATGANTGSIVQFFNGSLTNTSTQTGCYVQDVTSIALYQNVVYTPPNVTNCGIYISNVRSRITDPVVISPGTTATDVLRTDAGHIINPYLSGTFGNSNDVVTVGGDTAMIDGLINNGNLKVAVNGGKLTRISQGGGTLNIDLDGNDQSQISDLYQTSGTLAIASGSNDNRIINSDIATLTFAATSSIAQFVNCEITSTLTIGGDGVQMSNCTLPTTSVTGSDCQLVACRYANNVDITGDRNRVNGVFSTSRTLTLNSGAENNDIDVTIDSIPTDNSGNATNSIAYNEY